MATSLGKVGIIGPGAIGGFYGGMLALAGEDVHFLFRSTYDEVIEHGLTLVHHADAYKQTKVSPLYAYDHADSIGVCDWVIVAAKATANDRLAEMMSPMVGPSSRLLTLQNGMGNVENLLRLFGKDRPVVGGLCFTCINRTADGVIESLLPGYVQFGQLRQQLSAEVQIIAHAFSNAGIKVRTSDSLDEALWRKLCWNVPFNGLSIAAGGITTDLVLADPELKNRAHALMLEVQAAARSYGVEIEDAFLDRQFELTEPMGPYKPSSLIDYQDGKPVEVHAIWGKPLRRAQRNGVDVPEMDRIYRELQSKMKG